MKIRVPSFTLGELYEEVEQLVAPGITRAYMSGEKDYLERHCGEAAFSAVSASIKERERLRLTLDDTILQEPQDIVLARAMLMDSEAPVFVFTYNTQQINCLMDETGEVIEGAEDDIRTVQYAIAIQRHPEADEATDLEYPWMVHELAIVGNQPTI